MLPLIFLSRFNKVGTTVNNKGNDTIDIKQEQTNETYDTITKIINTQFNNLLLELHENDKTEDSLEAIIFKDEENTSEEECFSATQENDKSYSVDEHIKTVIMQYFIPANKRITHMNRQILKTSDQIVSLN